MASRKEPGISTQGRLQKGRKKDQSFVDEGGEKADGLTKKEVSTPTPF